MTKQGKVLATGSLYRGLYRLDLENHSSQADSALVAESLDLWHQRLAHVDSNTIKHMSKKGVVTGIKFQTSGTFDFHCDKCVMGKGHREPFPKSSRSRSTRLLELIHSDVCGPLEVPSLSGSRYFITFIDDFSRWTVMYTMKQKSEAFDCFVKFHKLAETHANSMIGNGSARNSRHRSILLSQETSYRQWGRISLQRVSQLSRLPWNPTSNDDSILASAKRSCRKNEQNVNRPCPLNVTIEKLEQGVLGRSTPNCRLRP